MKKILLLLPLLLPVFVSAESKSTSTTGPDCSGGWPTNMAFASMKNAGIVTNSDIDLSKTRTARLASEKIGKDLWHQVYLVTFKKTSGDSLEVVAVHDASSGECSMSGVEVFVVSKHLGNS